MIKIILFLVCLMVMPSMAEYSFSKNDLVGRWHCHATANVKNQPQAWVYHTSIEEIDVDGVSKSFVVGELGFSHILFRAFFAKSLNEWKLDEDKLYTKITHIDTYVYHDMLEKPDEEKPDEEKQEIIRMSAEDYKYPSIIKFNDKDTYTLTPTRPPSDDGFFDNVSPMSCRRMMD